MFARVLTAAAAILVGISPAWAARGALTPSASNAILSSTFGPLSGSAGPFTIAFWFRSGNVNAGPSYIAEGHAPGQWAVIYGYVSHEVEFYIQDNPTPRQNSGIMIPDTNWHHIVYRKDGSGASSWDRFLDGVKTTINPSVAFTMPSASTFFTFNADNYAAPCQCSLADLVIYPSALTDSQVLSLAQGGRPPALPEQSLLYWPLEGTSSPEPDDSGNNHPGTVQGNIVQVPDPPYGSGGSPPPSGTGSVARGAATVSGSNLITNSTYGPLSSSNGPFTIAFWFQSGNIHPGSSYVVEGHGAGQWAVIYGYTSQEIEFYTGDPNVRLNTGITITDTAWHHVAYRKAAAGNSAWDKFLDGVKTTVNSSANFSIPPVSAFYALNADNKLAPCQCNLGDVAIYNTALPDSSIKGLAQGARPSASPNLLLDWPLSGTSALEPDVSGNNHPGTVSGSIGPVPGPPYIVPESRQITSSAPSNSMIENLSYGPLASSNGPFTIAFWFQSENLNPGPSYIAEGYGSGQQWAVIYGYTAQQIEFYTGNPAIRQNTGMTIKDGAWHHVAYRKNGTGNSSWDRFLDGVKTTINPSINFSLPPVSSFYAFNADNALALCHCGLADLALFNASVSDAEIQKLAGGSHPSSLAESPLLYWPLSGASPETDASGNGHPGTIVGSVATATPPPYLGTVTVAPSSASIAASATQQFSASVVGGGSAVSWFLNPALGTINSGGLYQAPANISSTTTVTVTATSDTFPTQCGTATVTLTANSGPPPTLTSVLTGQYDSSRTNSNPSETVLNSTNVNVSKFGKLFSLPVDGYVYAQPLYVSSSVIPQLGHNTVFVATMHDSVFAFDGDSGAKLWSLSLGGSIGIARDYLGPETGIVSTPVIDVTRHTIYVVAANTDGWRIHAIDLLTHAEKSGSPVLIKGSVSGSGYDNVNNVVTFNAAQELQRASLLEANNTIYVAFTSYADTDPYHGWMFGYNADTLAQTAIFCSTPNGGRGGMWMGGGAPATDPAGNIYFVTANGDWDGAKNFAESFLKLNPSLALLDYFTPADWSTLNSYDADLGSTRAMLLPSTAWLMGGGKDGSLWLLNQTTGQMGRLQGQAGNPPIVQTFQATTDLVTTNVDTNGLWDGMAYWSSASGGPLLYIHGSNDVLKAFRLSGSAFNTTPLAQSAVSRPFPGGILAVSSNGSTPGVVWAATPDAPTNSSMAPGTLRAFDPMTLSELWDSDQNPSRDALGTFAKFAAPTVFNGKVYVATFSNQVVVYGLLP